MAADGIGDRCALIDQKRTALGRDDALRRVDAAMARDQVAYKRHDHKIDRTAPVKQVDAHHDGGDGYVEPAAEHAEHAEGGKEARVDTRDDAEPSAKRRADTEERRHFAALESRAERERGYNELEQCVGQRGLSGKSRTHEPRREAGIVPGAQERVRGERDERTRQRAYEVIGEQARIEHFDAADERGENAGCEAEGDAREHRDNDGFRSQRRYARYSVRLVDRAEGERC